MSRPATPVGSVVGVQAMGMDQWKHRLKRRQPESPRKVRTIY